MAMRALGKGSIAEIIRVGLVISWIVLWVAAGVLGVMAVAFALNLAGIINLNGFFAPENGVHLNMRDSGITLPPGAPTWPVFLTAILVGVVAVTGGLMIVWRLRKLFDSFCSGQPFAKENSTHLRAIWITMIGIEVARYLLLGFTGFLLANFGGPLAQHADIKLQVDLSTWASILILVVLAEVFREGARMKAEQELTI
jgi:hypothetical protein